MLYNIAPPSPALHPIRELARRKILPAAPFSGVIPPAQLGHIAPFLRCSDHGRFCAGVLLLERMREGARSRAPDSHDVRYAHARRTTCSVLKARASPHLHDSHRLQCAADAERVKQLLVALDVLPPLPLVLALRCWLGIAPGAITRSTCRRVACVRRLPASAPLPRVRAFPRRPAPLRHTPARGREGLKRGNGSCQPLMVRVA
jgi:hypothetical protein